jgi:hypothetical protein
MYKDLISFRWVGQAQTGKTVTSSHVQRVIGNAALEPEMLEDIAHAATENERWDARGKPARPVELASP